ncbi:MAG: AAC(3) family N-acetyltransferase [Anaerolineales bacterium]|jgi:aminoglycoside N3'-acetyltransferase
MREVKREQVLESLKQVGVEPGDGLLVHSALQFLGRPKGGVGIYLDALQEAVGMYETPPRGTLAAPVFNFGFASGSDYDPATAPAMGMGAFSEYFRQQPGILRTTHPMQSFAIAGDHAGELAALETPAAFDDGSAVDRMIDMGFKLLLLGADIQASSLIHYSEQRNDVPYRYWKEFTGQVMKGGWWQEIRCRMFVRNLAIDAHLEIYEIEDVLRERGQWSSIKLNYGYISLCGMADFVQAADDLLGEDPWRFVTNRPEGGA